MNKKYKQIKINTASAHEITAMSLSCVKKKCLVYKYIYMYM